MDLPVSDVGPTSEPAPTSSPSSQSFSCPHTDPELLHKLAQLLLPSLSAACIDSTTGDPFRSPASVAVDLRNLLISHISSRSVSFLPETLSLLQSPNPPPSNDLPNLDDPLDILSFLLEEFVSSNRNLLGRVSSWILSDSRDDKIDDFTHEMESTNFWSLDRRLSLVFDILTNLDYKNNYHCSMKFSAQQELQSHLKDCVFRSVECPNHGCMVKVCKANEEKHDGECLYKVLECEQRCGERILRREMDRHCITVCRMKMVNCPFYQIGCGSAFPQCMLKEHCGGFLKAHLVSVLRAKNEGVGEEALKEKAEAMEKSEFRDELAKALDVRSLTYIAKSVEAKMKKQQEQHAKEGKKANRVSRNRNRVEMRPNACVKCLPDRVVFPENFHSKILDFDLINFLFPFNLQY